MAHVIVKFNGTVGLLSASIDGKKLTFSNGTATKNLRQEEHALQWFVKGAPNSNYQVEITAPSEAKFSHEAQLDAAMKDAGVHWFSIAS